MTLDMTTISEFVIKYIWVILFYLTILLIVIINKKKFQFQAKFIALYKTKVGLNLMEKLGTKYSEFIKLLGIIGIGIGFVGMGYIFVYVIHGFIKLFTLPDAPAVFSVVLPGVHIPGSAVFVPFWHGIIALFIVVAFHEFGHGVVAKANKIPILSSGVVFFGPLIGAFVEPDEKKLEKKSDVEKYSVYAAGPFFNLILALFALALLSFAFNPLVNSMIEPNGFSFNSLQEGFPAEISGVMTGASYTLVNNQTIMSADDFVLAIANSKPGDNITIANSTNSYLITLTENPSDKTKGYLGVLGINSSYDVKEGISIILVDVLKWFAELLMWIFMLSIGLGAANLLPLGPVDGGRMIQLALTKIFGEKKGHVIWVKTGIMLLIIILILIFFPMIKAFF
jgi:membrane-associated protease RseP (regulator of RpoE activity)